MCELALSVFLKYLYCAMWRHEYPCFVYNTLLCLLEFMNKFLNMKEFVHDSLKRLYLEIEQYKYWNGAGGGGAINCNLPFILSSLQTFNQQQQAVQYIYSTNTDYFKQNGGVSIQREAPSYCLFPFWHCSTLFILVYLSCAGAE